VITYRRDRAPAPCGIAGYRSLVRQARAGVIGWVANAIELATEDGLGLAGLCQELRLRGRTPVLVATSNGGAETLDALAAGADDHVSIPCDARELRARLDALIRRARGPLSTRRVVKIGELIVRLGRGVVGVEPALPLTPVQSTLLGHLAGQPGVVLSEHVLVDRVRTVHGPTPDLQFDAELPGTTDAVELASGISDAVEHIDGVGWRLATERC
jgi:two-component system, OmpR family, response regulator